LRVGRNIFEVWNIEPTQYIGEFHLEEKSKPEITKLVADVIHFDEASYITWTSPNKGKG
jgi:hypothetical protein